MVRVVGLVLSCRGNEPDSICQLSARVENENGNLADINIGKMTYRAGKNLAYIESEHKIVEQANIILASRISRKYNPDIDEEVRIAVIDAIDMGVRETKKKFK